MKKTVYALIALALLASLLLALPTAAQAALPETGCPSSPDGRHDWRGGRPVDKGAWCTLGDGFVRICAYCHQEGFDQTSPPLGHDWSEVDPFEDPTCTRSGRGTRYCRRCHIDEEVSIPAQGHSWGSWQTAKAATCTAEGSRTRTCSRCGQTETQSIPKTEHSPVSVPGKPATCTDAGVSEGSKCSKCGAVLKAQQTLPATGHNWGPWKVEYKGTCVEKGMNVRKCAACGKEEYVYSDYGDHDWGEWQVVTPAGPGMPGLERRVCRINSAHVEERDIPPLPKALYVLKGVERDFDGYYLDASGCQPNYLDGRAYHFIWEDAEPVYFKDYHAGISQFFKDSGETISLMTEPVAGETYYFDIAVFNDIGNTDHSMDFSQVDAALVDVTMKGFTVAYLGFKPEARDDSRDACNLYFSATYLGKPELTLTYVKVVPEKEVYDPDDSLIIHYEVENTGSIPLRYVLFTEDYIFGSLGCGYIPEIVLQPGEKDTCFRDHDSVKDHIKPGTATAELLGMDEVIGYAYGFDADSIDDGSMASALCKSNTITSEFKVGQAAPGTYVLKGVSKDFPGVKESVGLMYPDKEPNPIGYTWADKEGKLEPEFSCLCLDSANSLPLASPPKKGETYYFFILLNNGFGAGDQSIDFSQIDPALVNVTLAGFDVQYLGYDYDEGSSDWVAHARLYFSAVCKQADGPELTLVWNQDENQVGTPYPDGTIFAPDDGVWADHDVTNTGNVPLKVVLYASGLDGFTYHDGWYNSLNPNESVGTRVGYIEIGDRLDPGSETEELLGTVTITIWYVGYDPDTFVDYENPGTELCRSNEITRVWKVGKEGYTTEDDPNALKPAISVTIWADPGAGDGKRYEGAQVPYHYEVTNIGNCPVYVSWWPDSMSNVFDAYAPNGHAEVDGMWTYGEEALLYPGETYSQQQYESVDASEVEDGYIKQSCVDNAFWYYPNGEIGWMKQWGDDLTIPLTYPPGYEPEPAKPALTLTWTHDRVYPGDGSGSYTTTEDKLYEPIDHVFAGYDILNAGNVPLLVTTYYSLGSGYTSETDWPDGNQLLHNPFLPGESDDGESWGAIPLSDYLTPDTATAELLGTVDITIWAKGFDPETGEELCESNKITRSWKVRQPGPKPWEIPEESQLTVSIIEYGSSNDAAGYQLTEYWDTNIYVRNEGPVDVAEYTLHVDYVADDELGHSWAPATDGATWYEFTYSGGITALTELDSWGDSPYGYITAADVARGYVKASAYVTWTDPDSGNPRQSNVASVSLPVISKTGLLLKKGIEKGPINEHYFQEAEPINWALTVTNTSSEPIHNVVVMDQGVKVGEFPVIDPGETLPCTVPPHVVTDYEADVAMTVVNIAIATGEDLQGAEHTWISNPVSVPANEFSPVPIPPVTPPEDPGKTPEDPGPGKSIDPPTEDPWKDKEKDKEGDPFIKGDGGDSCLLTLTALSDAEARYTLHSCAEHLAAAQAAQAATANSPDAGWDQAAEIWRAEIDKLYDALREAAQSDEARAAVTADQEAYWAYIDAFAAMNGDSPAARKALAETLRLRCAELCCMVHTAPEPLPDSLLGDYAGMMNAPAADETSRAFGPLNGSDCEVTVKLNASLSDAMGNALAIVRGSKSMYAAKTFVTAQVQWQLTLDTAANAAYKAADRDGRKLIAAWRKSVDQLFAARKALLNLLYADAPDVTEEALMNLYRNAAIDAEMMK